MRRNVSNGDSREKGTKTIRKNEKTAKEAMN